MCKVCVKLSNSLPCFTMKGWAKVNVAHPDVYVVENIAVVKCGSSSKFTCLVSIFSIIIYNIGKGKLKIR